MVISYIIGGLGNQLFQYAAGRCVAERNKVPLKLDIHNLKNFDSRNFDLEKFHTGILFATEEEIRNLRPSGNVAKLRQYLEPKFQRTYHRERSFRYDKSFRNIGPNAYLKGYFQCEDYFAPIADILRKEFTLKEEYTPNVLNLSLQLKNENSVALHVRRGDYTKPEMRTFHGVLTPDYYIAAMQLMLERNPGSKFFLFSDDIKWAKENLPTDNITCVSGEYSKNHFEDFYLMSQCQHNIIANSSYSWWTAWLNANPNKVVIGPEQWFTDTKNNQDRTPTGWLRI